MPSTTDDEITREACSRRRQRVEYGRDAEAINAGAVSWVLARLWWQSKASGVALIVHPRVCVDFMNDTALRPVPGHITAIEWQRYKVESQRQENERREWATVRVCSTVLMGYIEGRDRYARRLAGGLDDSFGLVTQLLADHSVPSYTEMRNFLIGEMDAHPVIAAAAAFGQRAMHNRIRYDRDSSHHTWNGRPLGERGWL